MYVRTETPLSLLKKYYGYSSFRKNQEEIISTLLDKQDAVCVMPTGGGKSICYQIPALLMNGITIVISPLIALMKDQVDTLKDIGIPAIFLNSSLSHQEYVKLMDEVGKGVHKLIYVSPERLESEQFMQFIKQLPIDFVAIDEAHCISQWGHDFRPSYQKIGQLIRQLPKRPVISAFTATATKTVINDIKTGLMLDSSKEYVSGYERENLAFSVIKTGNKKTYLLDVLANFKGESGIIYTATRKDVEDLHLFLEKNKINNVTYHGGMSEKQRSVNQEKFIFDDEKIMIATNAFGMGIDKSNVRFVVHYQLPKSMEAYYQEAGRAGRDGDKSECILLFSSKDVQTQKYLIEQSTADFTRKEHEYSKLQGMVDYCHTTKCLQNFIVEYFDDFSEQACNRCSNCKSDLEEVDVTTEALKIFSCIYRMKERFGITLVAQVLRGSNNKRIKELQLDGLSTYGIMKERTEKEIAELMQLFIAEGYLALTSGQYPTIKLAEKAYSVLKNKEKVLQKIKPRIEELKNSDHSVLFEALRQLRKKVAETEKIPPYIIFSDVTLKEMCKFQPITKSAMLQIKGVGEMKFEKYGDIFIELIKEHSNEASEVQLFDEEVKTKKHKDETPSYLITLELFNKGKSLQEIALDRELKETTVEQHFVQLAIEGLLDSWEQLIPLSYYDLIHETKNRIGAEKLKPLKEALPEEITYFHIKLALSVQKKPQV